MFSAYNLSAGLSIDSSTGVISGTIDSNIATAEQPQVNLWVTITVVNQADGDTSTISFHWLIQANPNLEPPLPATGHEHTHTGGDATTINDGGSGTAPVTPEPPAIRTTTLATMALPRRA
jgi:hypothetical protein